MSYRVATEKVPRYLNIKQLIDTMHFQCWYWCSLANSDHFSTKRANTPCFKWFIRHSSKIWTVFYYVDRTKFELYLLYSAFGPTQHNSNREEITPEAPLKNNSQIQNTLTPNWRLLKLTQKKRELKYDAVYLKCASEGKI